MLASSLDAPWENLFPCFFHLSEVTRLLGCGPPSPCSTLKASKGDCRPSRITSVWPSLPPFSTCKDPCDYTGPTWITQDDLSKSQLISNLNSIYNLNLSRYVTQHIHRFQGSEGRHLLWETIILPIIQNNIKIEDKNNGGLWSWVPQAKLKAKRQFSLAYP